MPARFERKWTEFGKLQRITSGASKAVFRLNGPGDISAVEASARDWLRKAFPYATVGVACTPEDPKEGFFAADERLTTKIRRAQMRGFSLASSCAEGSDVCEVDHVRPTESSVKIKGDAYSVSAPAGRRIKYGQRAKRIFMRKQADAPAEWTYTRDMEELATAAPEYAGNLNRKIALIYADGNKFGAILREKVRAANDQEQGSAEFDRAVQGKRRQFLHDLLCQMEGQRRWLNGERRRIEVLLWGGDEMMLIVPAWCGWETVGLFSKTMRELNFRRTPLKHGMGLIFAHQKAPIHALTKLVKRLGEEAKDAGRDRNRLSYLVLESFDHVGEDLSRFREKRWPEETARKSLVLDLEGDKALNIEGTLKQLKSDEFPRRKVFQAVLGADIKKDVEPFLNEPCKKDFAKWQEAVGGGAAWYHLADLWDYVGLDL